VNLGHFSRFGRTAGDTFPDPTHLKSKAHVVDQVIGLA
jgi:hypothetical protein